MITITFKTLQQKTFKIEIDESEKVKALKEKIAAEKGDEFPVEGQKLIYAGKILDDDKEISEYKIDTVKNFVVVMAVKPKAKPVEKPKPSTEESSSSSAGTSAVSTTATASTTSETTPTTAPASVTTAETTSTTTTPASSISTAESALLTGSALENSVTELMSLGYGREQVMRALNSSFHNADRAAEYLLQGNIPDVVEDDAPPEEGSNTPATAADPPSGSVGDLAFLRDLPQFRMLRQQVQQHPESLPQLLQEIGRSNPELLAMISQNQQSFINLLNDPVDQPGQSGSTGQPREGGFHIQVTPDEKATIDRIVAMGFVEQEVIQAFFACDKNEQLTINFLLSQFD